MTENFGDAETLAAIVSAGLCVGASTGDRHAAWSALSMLRGLAESTRAPAVENRAATEAQHHGWALDLLAEKLRAHLPATVLRVAMRYVIETREQLCGTRGAAVEAVELVEAKWIRCEERMPEPTERVFFVVDWRVYRGEFDGEEFMNAGMFSWASRDVSHWMHRPLEPALPAPPKEPARDE